MKSLYTTFMGEIYRIDQVNNVPTVIFDNRTGSSAKVNTDPRSRTIRQSFSISTLESERDALSNKDMFTNMMNHIRKHKITDIDVIQNRYKMYVDYETIYRGKSIDSATVTRDIVAEDGIVALGTSIDNENVFRHGKNFKTSLEFSIKNSIPYGVMKPYSEDFILQIYNIAIFEDFTPFKEDVHQSTYKTPYGYNNQTLRDNMENMEVIFSTSKEGIIFDPIKVNFTPRKIIIDLDVLLTNYIDVYDDFIVRDILVTNKTLKNHHRPKENDNFIENYFRKKHNNHMNRPKPNHKPTRPHPSYNKDYFYRRCGINNENRLLVIEDSEKDSEFYFPDTMVVYSAVVGDIPDISVGDYVCIEKIDRSKYHIPRRRSFPINTNNAMYYNPDEVNMVQDDDTDYEDPDYTNPFSGEGLLDPVDPDPVDPELDPDDDPVNTDDPGNYGD